MPLVDCVIRPTVSYCEESRDYHPSRRCTPDPLPLVSGPAAFAARSSIDRGRCPTCDCHDCDCHDAVDLATCLGRSCER